MQKSYDEIQPQPTSLRFFTLFVVLSQILGVLVVVMVGVWMGHFHGGFGWMENPGLEFNYHPLFMVLGLVFLYGDAMLAYRVFRYERKLYIKIVHTCLHAGAIIFAAVGLKAVFDSHNLAKPKPIANLYSWHAWMGLATVILFASQFVFGFVSYLWPKLSQNARELYMPLHRFWGMAIYVMAIATAFMGMIEKIGFIGLTSSLQDPERLLTNMLGLALLCLGLVVIYVVSHPDYKRQPLAEEQTLQLQEYQE
ncbi:cytochrome b561-like [Lingula anatina]|uniref:Cytochrome b561-like n=1 Tax=Lingula anatina TaxID=7574 RepID=A0A1S3J535_LINAN|nr:cytochrome b561-like [Lingula anatina]|eukprot:XP_013405376.1 cytochrome b561-like [Lingula anatina]